jgi:cystathionine beta-lyase
MPAGKQEIKPETQPQTKPATDCDRNQILSLVLEHLEVHGFSRACKALREELAESVENNKAAAGAPSLLEQILPGDSASLPVHGRKRQRTECSSGQGEACNRSLATTIVAFNPCKNDVYGAASMPIYQTATFAQSGATTFGEYDYTRSGNPTRSAAEQIIAELEGGTAAFCFSTGMAALSAVTRLATSGDEIILSDDSYGGTYRLLSQVAVRQGISTRYVDLSGENGPKRLADVLAAPGKPKSIVMLESPTNPMMRICDIKALADVAHKHNALVSVDNTLMSPLLQRPLELGADIVVESCTKFFCGHSDTMAGAVVVRSSDIAKSVYFYCNAEGTGLAPFDSWLLLRGLKTMHLRVYAAQRNAVQVARWLNEHPKVTDVFYGGSSKDNAIHRKQSSGGGSVVSFCTGNADLSHHIVTTCAQLGIFKITVSFGSVNSLISLPGHMSHASIPAEVRKERAFPEDLIRMSIGIENVEDIIADLQHAIDSYK